MRYRACPMIGDELLYRAIRDVDPRLFPECMRWAIRLEVVAPFSLVLLPGLATGAVLGLLGVSPAVLVAVAMILPMLAYLLSVSVHRRHLLLRRFTPDRRSARRSCGPSTG